VDGVGIGAGEGRDVAAEEHGAEGNPVGGDRAEEGRSSILGGGTSTRHRAVIEDAKNHTVKALGATDNFYSSRSFPQLAKSTERRPLRHQDVSRPHLHGTAMAACTSQPLDQPTSATLRAPTRPSAISILHRCSSPALAV